MWEFPRHEADPRIVPSDVVESNGREQRLTGIIASAMETNNAPAERL